MLDDLRQEGCLKARFPNAEPPDWPGAVTVNIAGGVAGGDTLETRIEAGPHTQVTIAAQAAERVYRALPGLTAQVATTLHVQPGAALEWLPQETILFDRCNLRRTLDIHLAPDAWFLGVESLVFGRTAMNEQVHEATLHDRIALHRNEKLLLHDAIRLEGPVAALLQRPAIANGAAAIATIILADPTPDPELLHQLRDALAPHDAGASLMNTLLIARIAAPDGAALRKAVITGLHVLRRGRTLPRVWRC